jgi:peptidoglycan/LPS O-acetylase OafA/YrhL
MYILDNNKKNNSIQIARIVAMIFIVLCHIVKYYTFIPGSQWLNVVLNVGVYMFLIISGYLYGQKNVDNFRIWIGKRIQRIYIPVLVTVFPVLIVYYFKNIKFSVITGVSYLFNLQGLLFLNWSFFSKFIKEIESLGHLWFTTIIMFCYLFVPLLQRIKSKKIKSNNVLYSLILMCIISCFLSAFANFSIGYFVTFIFGYYFGSYNIIENISKIKYIILTAITMVFQVERLLFMRFFDGTKYYSSFTGLSHMILGIWLVLSIFAFNRLMPVFFEKLCRLKVINHFDKMSYYIYIAHGLFYVGVFNVYSLSNNIVVSTILFIVCTYGVAIAIYLISKFVNNIIARIKSLR